MSGPDEEYVAAVNLFKLSVKICLRSFCTCLSTGYVYFLQILHFLYLILFEGILLVGTLISIPRISSYKLRTFFLVYPIACVAHSSTMTRIRIEQKNLSGFFGNILKSSESITMGKKCFIRTMRNFRLICTRVFIPVHSVQAFIFIVVPIIKACIWRDTKWLFIWFSLVCFASQVIQEIGESFRKNMFENLFPSNDRFTRDTEFDCCGSCLQYTVVRT